MYKRNRFFRSIRGIDTLAKILYPFTGKQNFVIFCFFAHKESSEKSSALKENNRYFGTELLPLQMYTFFFKVFLSENRFPHNDRS